YSCDLFFPGCAFDQICIDGLCYQESASCIGDHHCSEGSIFCGGLCRQAQCCMRDADPNAPCAPGTRCVNEICEGVACSGSGEVCTARVDCCGDLTCVHGVCQ